ncbi:patatin-like phospholipase family protein [Xanthomonas sp. CFBP 8703]|uniref:Patatin-like phospholipase family protein n=1 Tax=Xanthomonas bonasiae TaxID=2810351 RepID=A0ABS3AWT2_9XANT|nr:patatin-like phospholipase family protein [Xanthomonas bonasiae]MBN6100597.1 patatin-like phospholipase family protein [Xanthomonas bonasiae]
MEKEMSEPEVDDVRQQRVYVAFQGGGAKGAIHVGALRALESNIFAAISSGERLRAEIVGVAGTSAGSIMAALVACGYEADDLFGSDRANDFLSTMMGGDKKSLKSLFTRCGWIKLSVARILSGVLLKYVRFFLFIWSLILLLLAGSFIFPDFGGDMREMAQLIASYVVGISAIVAAAGAYFLRPGLAPLTEVRKAMDRALLSSKVFRGSNIKRVKFKDLEAAGGLPLKIVSTNLTTKGIQVFSARSTPDVSIADAVCASICLPYIFKPYAVKVSESEECEFVDGGLLSNLPLWVFDEERLHDPGSWTIGFSIVAAKAGKNHWLGSILDAVVAGPPEIHARGISNLMVVPLKTSIGMLDFGAPRTKFKDEIDSTAVMASETIISRLDQWHVEGVLDRLGESLVESFKREMEGCGRNKDFSFKLAIACLGSEEKRVTWFRSGYQFYDPLIRTVGDDVGSLVDYSRVRAPNALRLSNSLWLVALSLKSKTEITKPPLILIESPDLTSDDVCAIYECGSVAAFDSLMKTLADAVNSIDFEVAVGSIVFPEASNGNEDG